MEDHNNKVDKIRSQIEEYAKGTHTKKLRFAHGSSHSSRTVEVDDNVWIDISGLNKVVEVNAEKQYALSEPNVPMDALIEETLKYDLIPQIVMECPGITVGGGVNGAALESSSFRYGQFNDTCIDYEIILGDGSIVHANAKEHTDLFYGISGSYGTLGLLTLIKIKLIPAKPYVRTTFYQAGTPKEALIMMQDLIQKDAHQFIECTALSKTEAVVVVGDFADREDGLPVQTFMKATDPWFYEYEEKAIRQGKTHTVLIPIVDYMFRYDRGGFWMGNYAFQALNVPKNSLTKFLLNPIMNIRKLHEGFKALNLPHDVFVQDLYVPYDSALTLFENSHEKLDIYPVALCPMKPTQTPQKLSPHYNTDTMMIDVGIWGQSRRYKKDPIGLNREFETILKNLKGRKMLYAQAYYTEEEFWQIYDREWYTKIRKKYKADKVFPEIWQKVQPTPESATGPKNGAFLKFVLKTIFS